MPTDEVDDVKAGLLKKRKKQGPIKDSERLSTGSTILDLALSDSVLGGLAKGRYFFFVGDSGSGKSFLNLTVFAEAARNKNFDDHQFIYDDSEEGALFDFRRCFGLKAKKRIEHWRVATDPSSTLTLEGYYDSIDRLIEAGDPFIYVKDSLDSLPCKAELKHISESRKARETGKDEKGSMAMERAKIRSQRLRTIAPGLMKSGSILLVVGQARQSVGFGAQFNPRTRAGGLAPTYYATAELWTKRVGRIKKTVLKNETQIGIIARVEVKKNRLSGKEWSVDIPIYWSYGIDNIGGMIDFLVKWGHWSGKEKSVDAPEFSFKGNRMTLAKQLQDEAAVDELKVIVKKVWDTIVEQCQVDLAPAYD